MEHLYPIPEALLQAVVDYLGGRPARETRGMLNALEAVVVSNKPEQRAEQRAEQEREPERRSNAEPPR